ncbi:hypothetical protein GTY67_13475 [Streptomyces sp. SID8374]|uniref:DUF6221 family protein n=1 Tax=Streptomyces sp. SID8374 TaxID=2690354 RepID=UPI0013683F65|nr:DUF6221 family protein [Streptomyces sp. SID8374]MYX14407.1 hypothetical protein [Streptomyces sp. SID8374]
MTDTLVAFLRARLDDDEQVAGAADPELSHVFTRIATFDPEMAADERHIMVQRPARTLREVQAKRQLIDEHRPDGAGGCSTCTDPEDFDEDADGNRAFSRSAKPWPCPTVRLLALPYSDHLDYRQEWTP